MMREYFSIIIFFKKKIERRNAQIFFNFKFDKQNVQNHVNDMAIFEFQCDFTHFVFKWKPRKIETNFKKILLENKCG